MEECCLLPDKIDLFQQELAIQKEIFISLQSKLLFLQALQGNFDEDIVESLLQNPELETKKERLREVKESNQQTQREISTLVTNFSEGYARYENERDGFMGKVRECSENSSDGKENLQNLPPSLADRKYSRMLEYYTHLTDILEKVGGVKIIDYIPDSGIVVETTSISKKRYEIILQFCPESCTLMEVDVSPADIPFDDIFQHAADLGGDVRIFLGELLSRINRSS